MRFDALLTFSDRQSITSTAASENSVFLGAQQREVYSPALLQAGGASSGAIPIALLIQETFSGLTSLQVSVEAASSGDFSDAETLVQTGTVAAAELTYGRQLLLPQFQQPIEKRWMRLMFTVDGTASAGIVTAGIVDQFASQGPGKAIFLPPAEAPETSPPEGVTENIVDFAALANVDMFQNGMGHDTAFTIALKMTVQSIDAGQQYVFADNVDTYLRIGNVEGRVGVKVSAGTELFNNANILDFVEVGDVLRIVMSVSQTQAKVVINGVTELDETYSTSNNIDVPQFLNNRTAVSTNSTNQHYHGIWAARAYVDAEAFYSAFFDGDGDLTQAMFDGSDINEVSPNFHQAGNAAAWNSLNGVTGSITDFFSGGGSAPQPPEGSIYIESNAAFQTYLDEGEADPQSKDGDLVVFAPNLEITVSGTDWRGGFNATTNKRIWRSLDPSQPAIIREMLVRSTEYPDDADLGNMEFHDIRFDLSDTALLPAAQDNNQTARICVGTVQSQGTNVFRDFGFYGCEFVGAFPDYRVDNRDAQFRLVGINGFGWQNLTVEGCDFRGMSTGLQIGGRNLNIGRNRYKGNAEDFMRLSVMNLGGGVFDWSQDIVVVENIFGDPNSRNRLHPDFMQFDEAYAGSPPAGLGIRRVTWRGNITFEGLGVDCPIYPTGFGPNSAEIVSALPATPTDGVVYRLTDTAGGTYTLPDPALYSVGDSFAIQLEATDQTYSTWTIAKHASSDLTVEGDTGTLVSGYDLIRKNQTVEMDVISATEWRVRPKAPNNNMYQSNMVGADGSFVDIAFVNNAHITQGNGVRTQSNWSNVLIDGNLFARGLPGDRSGNGGANGHDDGYAPSGASPTIMADEGDNIVVQNNIAAHFDFTGGVTNLTETNNLDLNYGDEASLQALYPAITTSGDGIQQFPEDENEVITLFRPGTGTSADTNAQGPFGRDAANDPHDWSWVATHEVGPGSSNSDVSYTQATYPAAA